MQQVKWRARHQKKNHTPEQISGGLLAAVNTVSCNRTRCAARAAQSAASAARATDTRRTLTEVLLGPTAPGLREITFYNGARSGCEGARSEGFWKHRRLPWLADRVGVLWTVLWLSAAQVGLVRRMAPRKSARFLRQEPSVRGRLGRTLHFWRVFWELHGLNNYPCFSEIIVMCYLPIKIKLMSAQGMCTKYLTH